MFCLFSFNVFITHILVSQTHCIEEYTESTIKWILEETIRQRQDKIKTNNLTISLASVISISSVIALCHDIILCINWIVVMPLLLHKLERMNREKKQQQLIWSVFLFNPRWRDFLIIQVKYLKPLNEAGIFVLFMSMCLTLFIWMDIMCTLWVDSVVIKTLWIFST